MKNTKLKLAQAEPPCRGCTEPKRHMGCHSTCQEYVSWRTARNDFLKQKQKSISVNDAYMDIRHANLTKSIKHKHRQK